MISGWGWELFRIALRTHSFFSPNTMASLVECPAAGAQVADSLAGAPIGQPAIGFSELLLFEPSSSSSLERHQFLPIGPGWARRCGEDCGFCLSAWSWCPLPGRWICPLHAPTQSFYLLFAWCCHWVRRFTPLVFCWPLQGLCSWRVRFQYHWWLFQCFFWLDLFTPWSHYCNHFFSSSPRECRVVPTSFRLQIWFYPQFLPLLTSSRLKALWCLDAFSWDLLLL